MFTALITSVLGLTVAVPMYLFYLYFLGRAKRLVHRIERAGIEMVHLIADAREEEEFAPFRGEVTRGQETGETQTGSRQVKLEMTLAGAPGTAACGADSEYFRAVVAVVSARPLAAAAIRRGGGAAAIPLPA